MIFNNQTDMFNWIWDNRPHVSELSGRNLLPKSHLMWHWQFLHVLPKGKFKRMALNSDNILLGLPEEHKKQNQYPVFNEKYEKLAREYYESVRG